MLSVCPDVTGSLYYSPPGRGSSHFVAYSSCYCSLSALWDACPDPPWHVTLEMTFSMRLTAGSRTCPCVPVSLPLPSLSVRCSSPSISASAVQVFTLFDLNHVSLKNSSCRRMNLSLTPYKVSAGVKSRAQPGDLSNSPLMWVEKCIFYGSLSGSIIQAIQ